MIIKLKLVINNIKRININKTDAESLKRIRGIGEVLSNRIIKYRESLGGFVSESQLTEVYGLSDSVFRNLLKYIIVDSINVKKLNLNKCSVTDLNSHPYIDNYQANAIIKYRDFKKSYISSEEILENNLMPQKTFNKVKAYFSIE